MNADDRTVFIVDDDGGVRSSLRMLIRSIGLRAETFASGDEFLEAYDPDRSGCLILDVRMPGMSGIELQERLLARGAHLPIIFITAHGDVPMAVKAMQGGAVDFIQKPFRDQDLLDEVQRAMNRDARMREKLADRVAILEKIATLTAREREVMEMVVEGRANKAIAADLGISERTVEVHRARVMHKTEAESIPHLVRMVIRSRSEESGQP
jgi:FixJ family two-component response regulator